MIKITCNQHELSIENVCKSLTKQQLQHVFNPFYRSSVATKQHDDSSGIGLYTVKMLLDAKGLDYDFASRRQDMWFVVRFEQKDIANRELEKNTVTMSQEKG